MSGTRTSIARLALAAAGLLGFAVLFPAPAVAAAGRTCRSEGSAPADDRETRFAAGWNRSRGHWSSLRQVDVKPGGHAHAALHNPGAAARHGDGRTATTWRRADRDSGPGRRGN
ncbi:hypothetical protein [Pilimelia terevasa]|uniref:hypothetical protein n=1 Tax=Pilimelia terevasa TaxID=53372 RepID=UPI001667F537|nr:hypothetical protein [Pilimelia terevasa]